jgi:hypothetical protein
LPKQINDLEETMARSAVKTSASSVDSGIWRLLAWVGVALQVIGLIAVLLIERWGGAWIMIAFLAVSVWFLAFERRLPSLLDFLAVCASLVNAGGWVWNWYDLFIWFDEFVHAFTAFAYISTLIYVLWARGSISAKPGSGAFIVKAALLGFGLGIVWEIIEMAFLNLTPVDTIVDLVMDTLGAAAGGWLAGWAIRRQRH